MKERIEPGAYYAIVARGPRLPMAELYRWTVRDSLPRLPIPLREPDADIMIDLAVLVGRVYDLGRYARTLRHDAPIPETTSLTPEDRAGLSPRAATPRPEFETLSFSRGWLQIDLIDGTILARHHPEPWIDSGVGKLR